MKRIIVIFIIASSFCIGLCACGSKAVKQPTDYTNSSWKCEDILSFDVVDGIITDAVITNKEGTSVNASVNFTDDEIVVSSEDGAEKFFRGLCFYGSEKTTVQVVDIFSSEYAHIPFIIELKMEK